MTRSQAAAAAAAEALPASPLDSSHNESGRSASPQLPIPSVPIRPLYLTLPAGGIGISVGAATCLSREIVPGRDGAAGDEEEIAVLQYRGRNGVRTVVAVRCPGGRDAAGNDAGTARRSYGLPHHFALAAGFVPSVCYAHLDGDGTGDAPSSSLCVLANPELLIVHSPDGTVHEIPLPFSARAAFALPVELPCRTGRGRVAAGGLLVQKAAGLEDDYADAAPSVPPQPRGAFFGSSPRGVSFTFEGSGSPRPITSPPGEVGQGPAPAAALFVLRHPLEALRPVAGGPRAHERVLKILSDGGVSGDLALAVLTAYDVSADQHSLWSLACMGPVAASAPYAERDFPAHRLPVGAPPRSLDPVAEPFAGAAASTPSRSRGLVPLKSPAPLSLTKIPGGDDDAGGDGATSGPAVDVFLTAGPDWARLCTLRRRLVNASTGEDNMLFISRALVRDGAGWRIVGTPVEALCTGAAPVGALTLMVQRGRTGLYLADEAVANVVLIGVPGCNDPSDASLVGLSHAVGKNVEVTLASGHSYRVRVSLSLMDASPLAEAVARVTDMALGRLGGLRLRAFCLGTSFPYKTCSVSEISVDPMWGFLVRLLRSAVVPQGEPRCRGPSANGDPFRKMMRSNFHAAYCDDNPHLFGFTLGEGEKVNGASAPDEFGHPAPAAGCTGVDPDVLARSLPAIFDGLHLLREDCIASSERHRWVRPLGDLLTRLAEGAGGEAGGRFAEHYRRYVGLCEEERRGTVIREKQKTVLSSFARPLCFYTWAHHLVTGVTDPGEYPVRDMFLSTRRLHAYYSILFRKDGGHDRDVRDRMYNLVLAMAADGIRREDLELIPPGLALPLMEALRYCRDRPPHLSAVRSDEEIASFSVDAAHDAGNVTSMDADHVMSIYGLIGREDLHMMMARGRGMVRKTTPRARHAASSSLLSEENRRAELAKTSTGSDPDGLVLVEMFSSMLFSKDKRVHEAARLLRSSKPVFLRVDRAPEVSDHEHEQHKQSKLLLLCTRSTAAPLGRGMLTLGTLRPLLSEPLVIPEICLAGRVPPTNVTVKLDLAACPPDMVVWPQFHNGVAAGLRLAAGAKKIPRTWIIYNRPSAPPPAIGALGTDGRPATGSVAAPDHAHGGLLMAFGLQGHLSSLAMTDIYEYLTQNADTTTVGVLIGMAASRRGTCDPGISKMLCLHIPSLLPTPFTDMERSSVIQSAALAGVGFLYQGSAHRLMTEFLLGEMGRRPSSDKCSDRESYALSTGLALGLVTLGRGCGGGAAGLADLKIEERLYRYMVGGKDPERVEKENAERAAANQSGEQVKCSRIYEGEYINTDVTAPGATLALGLMYIRSGNKSVAARLNLPETQFLLDYVRSDFLLLRVISKSLILWENVEPTTSWVNSQFPDFILKNYNKLGADASSHFSLSAATAAINIQHDQNSNGMNEPDPSDNSLPIPDPQIIRQAYVHISAGACFALGLRYAGSGDIRAARVVTAKLLELRRLRNENDILTIARRPERPILEMCITCCAVGLAMVMAGTGDLDTMRLLRELRWKCDSSIRHGTHMAFGAAIGLIFLGGGACTLGREPEDIAALVMAFFPRFPMSSEDNQYHLQALRHVYVLAVKHHEIEAIDVDTKQPLYLPIKIRYTSSDIVSVTAPCVLRNVEAILSIDVVSERYYPLSISLNHNKDDTFPKFIYVKKKSGYLSYARDPNDPSLPMESYGKSALWHGSHRPIKVITNMFSEDPMDREFAKYFCMSDEGTCGNCGTASFSDRSLLGMGAAADMFCFDKLFECTNEEKNDALRLYIATRFALRCVKHDLCVRSMWDIKLIVSYYTNHHKHKLPGELISLDFVEILRENVKRFFIAQPENTLKIEEIKYVWSL